MELSAVSIPEQRPLSSGQGMFPLVLAPCLKPKSGAAAPSSEGLAAWCSRNSTELRALMLRHGAVLLRDCGLRTADDFALVTRAIGCEGYDYVGGAAPRTEVVPGVVFTSNESPPDQPIPFHHELAQSPTPPAYISFFCEREAAAGGATPIIPSDEVAEFFFREFPDFAKKLQELGVQYMRIMPEVTDPTSAQGRSWSETYGVSSREEAEESMRKQGTTWEWLPNGDCKSITAVLPALRTDSRSGKRVFFNSVVAAFTGWNDSRNVGEKAVMLGDGTPVDAVAIRAVATFMSEREVAFRWKRGDVLMIDNTLAMHSRQTFKPPRRVLAALRGPPLGTVEEGVQKPLRIGILGTGAMGKEHIRNFALLADFAIIVAVADHKLSARKEALAELGRVRGSSCAVFSTDEDLLACDFVDAVVICTPNHTHIDQLRRAIPTGKHILCEKPLCTTVEDCEEVERLLAERDAKWTGPGKPGIFMTGMEYRWMPPITRLIEETDSKILGEPRLLSIREHRFPFLVKVDNWNRFNRNTGGTLVEKACHFFDLMRRILGSEPVSVYASGNQEMNHKDEEFDTGVPDIIDHALVVVEFENGSRASLDLCMFAEDEQTEQVRVVCQKGSVESRSPESTIRIVQRRHIQGLGRQPPSKETRAVPRVETIPVAAELAAAGYHEGATFFELREFLEAARGERPVPVTARDGKMAVLMGCAAHWSIATGRIIKLSPEGRFDEDEPTRLLPLLEDALSTPAPSPASSAGLRARL
mmetsp:Transcript_31400/g.50506  ORF Transcript_31400/g.50506 Transcript_31400/m.50506 type:complete len:757 (-) Transcript_31400:300-2570(-)